MKTCWKYITTTSDWRNNLDSDIKELKSKQRNFVWYSFTKEGHKEFAEKKLKENEISSLFLFCCMKVV